MAPKGGNAKKESGRAKKAENEAKKTQPQMLTRSFGHEPTRYPCIQERKEADQWQDGAKAKKAKEDKEEKRRAELARKAETARLLAEEEAAAPAKAKTPAKTKKAPPKLPSPQGLGQSLLDEKPERPEEPEEYAATGIDNALDLLDVVTAKMDKASVGQQAAGLERHPERRFKGAFEAYKEREMPIVRAEHPGLRLQQYQDLLFKQFQKSPENPFNQTTVAYDASKEEKVNALKSKTAAVEERLRA
ncbi:DUF1014-domain-containing protein [Amylocystis lapponica]|nr:DUF1014-domain-containing protein [Amylocystis lapponica]